MKDAADGLSGASFILLNIVLAVLAWISAVFPALSYVSLLVLLCLLVLWIVNSGRKGEWHSKVTAKGRIEAEIGIYSSFLFWFGIYCIIISSMLNATAAEDPLFALTVIGMVGWFVSALPLTKMFGSGG
jgi:hypothetical protein